MTMIPVMGAGEEGLYSWRDETDALEIREAEERNAVPRARLWGTVGGLVAGLALSAAVVLGDVAAQWLTKLITGGQ